jgi:hypothetical protein
VLRSRFIVNSISPSGNSRQDSTAYMYAVAGQRSRIALARAHLISQQSEGLSPGVPCSDSKKPPVHTRGVNAMHAELVHAIMSNTQLNREDAMHHTMVPSDCVEHVAVHSRDRANLGMIERLMLYKASGTVAYAVIKTGGWFGSHHHYPVPWSSLRYDPQRQVYETEMTLDDLRAGPSEFDDETFDWGDRSRSYPHPHYWTV